MKRLIPFVVVLVILGLFAGTLWFLYKKSQKKPVVFETGTPLVTDIVKKTVATGAIVPRKEVELKPRVSGIIHSLHVEPGQYIEEGQLVAQIRIVPNVANLNQAESRVDAARISFANAERELKRHQGLLDKQVISETEFARYRLEFELKKQELDAASRNLQIVRDGAARAARQSTNNTQVRSTVAGTVLEVPVKEGFSVIESNTFNPGTTIAVVADMKDMIFQGQVDESEVGKLKEGMDLDIKVGALDSKDVFAGKLEYIAPKGVQAEGVIKFEVKAAITPREGVLLRAGYSANADIVLDRRTQVLAISERFLQFDKGKPYVEVEVAPQTFERRDVQVGLSDGLNIELLGGVDASAKLKKP